MTAARKWMQELEKRYGIRPEFAGHLLPLLEHVAARQPSVEEWERLLNGVAAAYRAGRSGEQRKQPENELGILVSQFNDELRKVDESLKVLGVYLERLRERANAPQAPTERVLH